MRNKSWLMMVVEGEMGRVETHARDEEVKPQKEQECFCLYHRGESTG